MKVQRVTEFSRLREKAGIPISKFAKMYGKSVRTIYRWEKGETNPDPKIIEELKFMSGETHNRSSREAPLFKFIDLFAGIGGLRKPFENLGGQCVFTSEWDKACLQTYQSNFNCDHEIAGDIREVNPDSIPDFDLLLAGFPCQPFSIAGVTKKKSLGLPHGFRCDTQGTLFFEVAQLIERRRPVAFLLENVKNLVSHDRGRTFSIIMRTLEEELGYNVSYRVIDAKGWVPQHRERIFIVGFRDETTFSFDDMDIPDPQNGPRLGTILHPEDGSEEEEPPYTVGLYGKVADKYTLSDRLWEYLQNYAAKHRARGNGFGFGLCGRDDVARTLSARYYKDGSEILIRQPGKNPRRLTPRECARLMGFDKPGEKSFVIPVSDTQAYRQFGNSVVVPVVEAVARHMFPYILEAKRKGKEVYQPTLFEVIENA